MPLLETVNDNCAVLQLAMLVGKPVTVCVVPGVRGAVEPRLKAVGLAVPGQVTNVAPLRVPEKPESISMKSSPDPGKIVQ